MHVSACERPGHQRRLELSRQNEDQEVHAPKARRPGRNLALLAVRYRPRAGISQVHRVLPMPCDRDVLRDHNLHEAFIGPRFFVDTAALEMNPLDTESRTKDLRETRRHRLLQHHEMLHQGLPGRNQHHRQRNYPAEGTRCG